MSQPWGFSCKGGLNVNLNQLEMLSQPGFATRLRNFEVDPDGGYRRINGFTAFGDTQPNSGNAVLGMAVYADGVIVCSGTGIFFSVDGEETWLQINRASVDASGDNYSTFTGGSVAARTSQGRCTFALYEGTSDYGELVICCDDRHYWRKEVFKHYKAGRKKDRDKSDLDWNSIHDIMNTLYNEISLNFPYKNLKLNKVEADDIIAVLCQKYNKEEKILIVSSDKDFQQLQRYENVKQYSPLKKSYIACEEPENFILEHIIKGDSSDGIPNILSDDDTFVNKEKRQSLVEQKRFAN